MFRSIKILCLSFILSTGIFNLFSQYYVKSNEDSVAIEIDYVIFSIDDYPGLVNWERSKDTLTWESLNQEGDTILIRIDSSAFYRAVISVENCEPVKSDIAQVGFKSAEVEGKIIEADSTGGVFILPSGIKVIIPPGAVAENTVLTFELTDEETADFRMPFEADTGKVFGAGIYCEPAGRMLLKPIKIKVPVENYLHTDLPFVFLYNSISKVWNRYTGSVTCSEKDQIVEFSIDQIQSARILFDKDIFSSVLSGKKSLKNETDCKEGLIRVYSESYDFSGTYQGTECYVITDVTKVTFLECPEPNTASASGYEIGKDCQPNVFHTISKKCIKPGESATLTITVTIGGIPLKNQQIIIDQPDGLIMTPDKTYTDESGQAKFTIQSTVDNFDGSFYYLVLCDYYLQQITAEADGQREFIQRYRKSINIKKTQSLSCVIPELTAVYLNGGNLRMKKGGTGQLNVICADQFGDKIECGQIEYFIESSFPSDAIISIDPKTNVLGASHPGTAVVRARCKGIVSNPVSFSIAYEAPLTLQKYTDHTSVQECGCKEEYTATGQWSWYKLYYNGDLNISFWLSPDPAGMPTGKINGYNTIRYLINSQYCKDTLIIENVDSHFFQTSDIGGFPATTQDVVDGVDFESYFDYWDWRGRGFPNTLPLECKMISPSEIRVRVASKYWPEYCVGRWIEGEFVLH